jgi:hypothetical protein
LNLRPLRPERSALPSCATPRCPGLICNGKLPRTHLEKPLVGIPGLEPGTSRSPSERPTELGHIPFESAEQPRHEAWAAPGVSLPTAMRSPLRGPLSACRVVLGPAVLGCIPGALDAVPSVLAVLLALLVGHGGSPPLTSESLGLGCEMAQNHVRSFAESWMGRRPGSCRDHVPAACKRLPLQGVFAPACYGHAATASAAIRNRTGVSPLRGRQRHLPSARSRVPDLTPPSRPPERPGLVSLRKGASGARAGSSRLVGKQGLEPCLPRPKRGALASTRYPVEPPWHGVPPVGIPEGDVEKTRFERATSCLQGRRSTG